MRKAVERPYTLSGEGGDAYTFAAGVTHLQLNPLATAWLDSRITTIGLTYQQFRFVRFRLEVYLPSTSATLVIGYTPGALATDPPALVQEVCELPVVTVQQTGFVRPAVLALDREILCVEGDLKWWTVSDDSSTNLSEETQGTVHFYSPGTVGVVLRTFWTVEFCAMRPINVSNAEAFCGRLLTRLKSKWGQSHTCPRDADGKMDEDGAGLVPSTDVVVVASVAQPQQPAVAAYPAVAGGRKQSLPFR